MENTHGLRLRRAEKEDCRFLYELRNEEKFISDRDIFLRGSCGMV